jgi:tRNA 2-selenouridine synthase
MIHHIEINEFYSLRKTLPVLDVRSPGEFMQGHIPNAINLPLFDDDERKTVGTIYKHHGRDPAIIKGLDFAGKKLSGYVKQAKKSAPGKKTLMHCWRGGMRSESMAWLLSTAGFEVFILKGGYKAYRKYNSTLWDETDNIIILSGKTGSGKTEILRHFQFLEWQALDLEHFAHHKGSSFGAIGELPQPTSEQFENDLADEWRQFDQNNLVWIEDESRTIGKVFIPENLYERMKDAKVICIEIPHKLRVERLIADYAKYPKTHLVEAINRITRRIGGQNAKRAINALENEDYHTAVEIILDYYDKAYTYDLTKKTHKNIIKINLETDDAKRNAETIKAFLEAEGLK